ncbi:hypothetical protein D3C81_1982610 [compost metagenome]
MIKLPLYYVTLAVFQQNIKVIRLVDKIINHPPLPVILQHFFGKHKICLAHDFFQVIILVIQQPELQANPGSAPLKPFCFLAFILLGDIAKGDDFTAIPAQV